MLEFGDILVYVVTLFGLYTAIFFIMTIVENKKTLKKQKTNWKPKVAVIVPCFNEEKTVVKTVTSLLNLNYPRNKLDIIIVDDGSTDNTYKIAKQFEKQNVRVFKKTNGGKHTAINLGLENTNAEIAGALDADSIVDPEALNRMLPFFLDKEVMAVTPSMKIYDPQTWLQRIQMLEYLIGIFLRKVFALLGSIHVCPGPFSLYKTSFFKKHGNFTKAHLTEDIEMALRIQSLHYHIENSTDAYVHTIGPSNFKDLYKQRLRWYHGFIQNVLDYKHLFGTNHGNLGMFVLPGSFISVFLVLVTIFYMGFKVGENLWNKFVYMNAIGWDWSRFIEFKFDTFFFNFGPVMILSIMTIFLSIGLFIMAKKIAGEKESIKYSYLVYVFTYWLLFGFWWFIAFTYKIFNIKTVWDDKSSSKG